jgi:hypothetical protein
MKAPEDDFFLARHVLENNLVSREALLECLFQMAQDRKAGAPRPLAVMITSRGLMTESEVSRVLSGREKPSDSIGLLSDEKVGNLLVKAGLISKENVEECARLQQEMQASGKSPPPIGELVVARGYATEPQVTRALAYQNKALFACDGCGVKIRAAPPPPGNRYRCKSCGGSLASAEPTAPPSATMLPLRETERGEDTQFEIDRAVAAYMKQKGQVRRDQLREAQRLQMEFSRYGLIVTLLELLRRTGSITWQQQQDIERMDFARIVQQPDWKGQTIPGYRLRSRIASGGFAAIWTAETLFERREVAIKVLHPERAKDPRAVARFEWEAMLLRRLNCPHIVRGLDHGFERGQHYLVMEYVDGRSLGQLLSETGAFPVRNALSAARQVAEALCYLHREGYLHRDVKPDNALIDGKERVKLCDLGFAVPIPQHAGDGARKSTAVGTAGYISPEAMRGETDVKVGVDIYSLGILLYALLTGHEPFEGASSEEVVTHQIESGMPVPNLMLVDAPPVVVLFLKRLMHPDRTKRFPSMVEVLAAMDQLLTVL